MMLIESDIVRRNSSMLPLRPALLATALIAANLVHAVVPAGAPLSAQQQAAVSKLVASEVQALTPWIASAAAASLTNMIGRTA